MREPANDGAAKGMIGGGVAVLVGIGAMVARFGDDIGMAVGGGARLVDDVAVGGAAFDDVARLGDDAAGLGRLGDDVLVSGAVHEASLSDDAGHLVDLLSHGVDLATLTGGDDPVVNELRAMDPSAKSGRPVISYAAPSPEPGPQLVLVVPGRSPEEVLARCVTEGRWCVVQVFGGEDRVAVHARYEEQLAWWEREHPSDAEWVAALGARIPAGVAAAWLVPGDRWTIAHP